MIKNLFTCWIYFFCWIALTSGVAFAQKVYDEKEVARDLIKNKAECLVAINKFYTRVDQEGALNWYLREFQKALESAKRRINFPRVIVITVQDLEDPNRVKDEWEIYLPHSPLGFKYILVYDFEINEDSGGNYFFANAGLQLRCQILPNDLQWNSVGRRYSATTNIRKGWAKKIAEELFTQLDEDLDKWRLGKIEDQGLDSYSLHITKLRQLYQKVEGINIPSEYGIQESIEYLYKTLGYTRKNQNFQNCITELTKIVD